MRIPFLNIDITRDDQLIRLNLPTSKRDLDINAGVSSVESLRFGSNWWSPFGTWMIHEPNTAAWQRNMLDSGTSSQPSILAFSAVYACITGIASDIAKLRIKLTESKDGIWEEVDRESPFKPVLEKPNHYQTRIRFLEQWMVSKLLWGNTYVLKKRDQRGIVTDLYILHPACVTPLIADDGSIFYELKRDKLSEQLEERLVVPAAEIIHDMMTPLWHPLVGVSPLFACAISAGMGTKIQSNSNLFFGNMSRPGGILTAPGHISDDTATRLKDSFETNYGGTNIGRIAVLGDGLKFETMAVPAEQAQLIEQLNFTVEDVARAFHYPMSKLAKQLASYAGNVVESSQTQYYTDCLQIHIESIEVALDDGLRIPSNMGTELDLDCLLRMDGQAMAESIKAGVSAGVLSPNEGRAKLNYRPVTGGDSPYLQQQNFSLEALAKRDAQSDPFATKSDSPVPATSPSTEQTPTEDRSSRELDPEDWSLFYVAKLRAQLRKVA